MLLTYILEQISILLLLHALFLYWGVAFPFHYRQLKVNKRLKYAHIITVVLALVVPLSAALVPLKEGFIITSQPTLVCGGRSTDIIFYTFILPASIFLAATSMLLVLMFWAIFKASILEIACAYMHEYP